MASTDADKTAIADYIASRGSKVTAHSGDPGKTGANQIGTSSGNTTWGAAAIVTDPTDGEVAVATGSPVPFTIPASTTVSHFGIWDDDTFLRGYELDASITVNAAGSAPVDLTPKIKYKG